MKNIDLIKSQLLVANDLLMKHTQSTNIDVQDMIYKIEDIVIELESIEDFIEEEEG